MQGLMSASPILGCIDHYRSVLTMYSTIKQYRVLVAVSNVLVVESILLSRSASGLLYGESEISQGEIVHGHENSLRTTFFLRVS